MPIENKLMKKFAEKIKEFARREEITFRKLLDMPFVWNLLVRYRYVHFFATGVSGVLINLSVTWVLTTFLFGVDRYFTAYIFGIAANLAYNFTLYSIVIFGTKRRHVRRFLVFVIYSLIMTFIQAYIVKIITPVVGYEMYLLVIAATIFVFSTFNFFVFKLSFFRE